MEPITLEAITDETLDTVLSMSSDNKVIYFATLVDSYYPEVDKNSEDYVNLVETYMSSFYVEKLYRSNRFFNEKFTPIYTNTGMIRNITADLFFSDKDLLVH